MNELSALPEDIRKPAEIKNKVPVQLVHPPFITLSSPLQLHRDRPAALLGERLEGGS
jgi:hypothetical protein